MVLNLKYQVINQNILIQLEKVYKVEVKSNLLLKTFDTILNASLYEDISRASMSRAVKNKTVFKNDYYYTSDSNDTISNDTINNDSISNITITNNIE